MKFSENLHFLRKRDKTSQEELAEKLGVSRQSVSKWETGEAYPETEKLIAICDLFGVTLDELMRGDLAAEEGAADSAAKPVDGAEFVRWMNLFSRSIAAGVFLILFGTAVCVALAGYSESLSEKYSNLVATLGGVAVVLCSAAAMFLFVYSGMRHDRFRKKNPVVENVIPEERIKAFMKKFPILMASLVSGILLDVVFLILMSSFIDAGIVEITQQDSAYSYVAAAFLFVLAFLVGGLVYLGIQHTKYDAAEYNKQNRRELNPSPRSRLKDALCGVVMMAATALFLVLGFVWGLWHPAWVAFPVGGIICGMIGALMGAKDDHDK